MAQISCRQLTILSVAAMVATVAISIVKLDWMWVLISAIGIVAISIPILKKGRGVSYHRAIQRLLPIPFILYLALFVINMIVEVSIYRYLSLIIQSLAAMICGYMLFISLDVNTDVTISKRWLFVFALTFTCTFAVLYTFFLFVTMESMGYPLYNYQFEGPDALDNTDANRFLMLPLNLAIVFSLLYGLIIDRSLKGVDVSVLNKYYGADGNEQ